MNVGTHTHVRARIGDPSYGAGLSTRTESPRTTAAVRLSRWRLLTDAAVLGIAASIEAASAPAAGSSGNVNWRVAFVAVVLVLLALRGAYRPTPSQ